MSSQEKPNEPASIPNVVNPRLFLEPSTIKNPELYRYTSTDMIKLQHSFKNYKRSGLYILGILGGCAIFSIFINKAVKSHIFGSTGNGGDFLKMYTVNTTDDYYYNREFQRMRYLTEEPVGDDPSGKTRDDLLWDLGYRDFPKGHNYKVQKRAPHYKYF